MAQLKAVSSSSSLNLPVDVPKRDLFLCSSNISFAKKSALFQELGARKSEVQGDAVVSNRGNALRVHCNKVHSAHLKFSLSFSSYLVSGSRPDEGRRAPGRRQGMEPETITA
ncbi:hypothetical protein NC652_026454 [Populus alba x Populus x berolinensis]|nr:hypothetical protein NC652_026454 [Populus alba x Populus x berolinensis]